MASLARGWFLAPGRESGFVYRLGFRNQVFVGWGFAHIRGDWQDLPGLHLASLPQYSWENLQVVKRLYSLSYDYAWVLRFARVDMVTWVVTWLI